MKIEKYYYIFLLVLFSINAQAQMVGFLNVGTGLQGDEWLSYETGGALGYNFFNNALCGFGGIKVQKFPLVSSVDLRGNEDNYTGQTTNLWNYPLYGGLRYSLNILEIKKGSEKYIGFFPECRLYFSPLLPRKIIYVENNYPEPDEVMTLKSKNMSQWAYAVGGGIYFGNRNNSYIAIKFETSTIDLFESIRSLSYKNDIFDSRERQYIISLSLYGLIRNKKSNNL